MSIQFKIAKCNYDLLYFQLNNNKPTTIYCVPLLNKNHKSRITLENTAFVKMRFILQKIERNQR